MRPYSSNYIASYARAGDEVDFDTVRLLAKVDKNLEF